VRSTNLRNKPVDRRYLSDQDKNDYNQSGEYGRRAQALSRARGRKGQMAYQANRPMNTQSRTQRSGGMNYKATELQAARMAEMGASRRSEFSVKPPSSKGDLFKKE
jgi:hypothetical protein